MANIIEIRVRATDETGPTYDAAKARALEEGTAAGQAYSAAYARAAAEDYEPMTPSRVTSPRRVTLGPTPEEIAEQKAQIEALRQEMEQAGDDMGEDLVDSVSDTVGKEVAPKLTDPIRKSGSSSASTFVSGFQSDLDSSLSGSAVSGMARAEGEQFSISFGQGAKDAIQDANLSGIIGDALDDGADEVLTPESPAGKKIQDNAKKTGTEAGKGMGDGMSPLIVSALAGAAAIGAPLLLAGMGTAFVGVTALALKSNKVIANDYQQLGKSAEGALTQAAAPLAGTMHQALQGMESTVQQLTPELKGLFANAEPDITAVASGVDAFASGILPGMSDAIKGSQVIVQDFGASMGPLGQNIGGFFQGLTRDASTTGEGLESLLGTAGHLVNTLGGALGSAASVGSTALMGLDPVINTTLSLIQKIDSPGVVGAGAGLFASWKIDPSIATGLGNISTKLTGFAKGTVDADGEMSSLGKAASGMSGALSKGASVMSGPWGMAIGAGVGLVTGLVGSLINASHASDALTLSQQSLDQAVQQDSGHVGEAVTSLVAAQAQTDGLAQSAQQAGVSLSTWTQAVIGNKAAQDEVTGAVTKTNQALLNQGVSSDEATQKMGKYASEQENAQTSADASAASTNRLTSQNARLLNSMQAQNQQIVDSINKQTQLTAATNTLSNATAIFAASVKGAYQAQVTSAQQSALTTVASLNLGNANTTLSQKLYNVTTAYTMATGASSAYNTILTGLNGTTMGIDQAQNTLASQMVTAKQTFSQNSYSLNINTQAGVSNRQALVSAAQAITALGVAQYQATGDINQGNSTIQKQITAFVNATGATGKAKTAIEQYLEQITKIPPNVSTNVKATVFGMTDVQELQNLLDGLGGIGGSGMASVQIARSHGFATGGNVGAAAVGGAQGGLTWVGEQGPELLQLPYGSSVMSNPTAMGYGGFGGEMTVRLEVASTGGNGLERMFISWLKGAVRAVGGSGPNSVQRALGQVA